MIVWPDKMPFLTLGADMARPSRTGGKTSEAKTRKASPLKGRKTAKSSAALCQQPPELSIVRSPIRA